MTPLRQCRREAKFERLPDTPPPGSKFCKYYDFCLVSLIKVQCTDGTESKLYNNFIRFVQRNQRSFHGMGSFDYS